MPDPASMQTMSRSMASGRPLRISLRRPLDLPAQPEVRHVVGEQRGEAREDHRRAAAELAPRRSGRRSAAAPAARSRTRWPATRRDTRPRRASAGRGSSRCGDFGTNDRARLAAALGASPSTDSDKPPSPAPRATSTEPALRHLRIGDHPQRRAGGAATETKSMAIMTESWRSIAQYSILTSREMM